MAKSGGFGLEKSIPQQGGVAKAPMVSPLVTDKSPAGAGTVSTPDLGKSWAKNVNMRPGPTGGSTSKNGAGGPKPFNIGSGVGSPKGKK